MIDWTARAAAHFHGNGLPPHPQNPQNDVSGVSAVGGGAFSKKSVVPKAEPANDPADAYARWTLHFADRREVSITFAPPVARDEALRRYPAAVAAVPILDPPPALRGCATCRHRSRFGNCGEPVAAGLVETFRLERHPTGGSGCAVFDRKPIVAEYRVAALLDAGLLDQDDATLIRLRYDDDPDQWDQLLDDIERTGKRPTD